MAISKTTTTGWYTRITLKGTARTMNRLKKLFSGADPAVLGLGFILLLEYAYIFLFLLNYHMAWMNGENFATHAWSLSNGKQWRWEDFGRGFNIDVLELGAPRFSRLISVFFELVNAKFRAYCWNFFPPHPSLSCLWPLFFAGVPFFLFKFFRNMGCGQVVALSGIALYLASIGFLAPVVMLFHPAKSMVNFFAAVVLFTGSRIYRKSLDTGRGASVKNIPYFWFDYAVFLFFMLGAFFSDETGLFVYVIAAFMFYPVFFRFKERFFILGSYVLLPAVYVLAIYVVLPRIYMVKLSNWFYTPSPFDLFSPDWRHFWTNFFWLSSDHPHIELNPGHVFVANKTLFFVQGVYTFVLFFILFSFIRAGARNLRPWIIQVMTGAALVMAYVYFFTFQLSRNAKVWGVWWYGSLYSLVYFIVLTFVLQFILEGKGGALFKRFFVFIVFIMVVHGMAFSTYRVDIFAGSRRLNYLKEEVFTGKIDKFYKNFSFTGSVEKSRCRYFYTVSVWARVKQKKLDPATLAQIDGCRETLARDAAFPEEAQYLAIEL